MKLGLITLIVLASTFGGCAVGGSAESVAAFMPQDADVSDSYSSSNTVVIDAGVGDDLSDVVVTQTDSDVSVDAAGSVDASTHDGSCYHHHH
jgi:hypothetical protein